MEDRNVRRGDIYHADLDPVFGSEQGGYRPEQRYKELCMFCNVRNGYDYYIGRKNK